MRAQGLQAQRQTSSSDWRLRPLMEYRITQNYERLIPLTSRSTTARRRRIPIRGVLTQARISRDGCQPNYARRSFEVWACAVDAQLGPEVACRRRMPEFGCTVGPATGR